MRNSSAFFLFVCYCTKFSLFGQGNVAPAYESTLIKSSFNTSASEGPTKTRSTSKIDIYNNTDTVFVINIGSNKRDIVYKGTPYFKNDYFFNENLFIDGMALKGVLLYDIAKNDIIFSADSLRTQLIMKPDSFTISGHFFINMAKKSSISLYNYYEKIFSSKQNQVFKKYYITLKPYQNTDKLPFSNQANSNQYDGVFETTSEFYFLQNNKLKRWKQHENFFDYFGKHKAEIEWFISAKQLDVKKQQDILDIMKYYSFLNNDK